MSAVNWYERGSMIERRHKWPWLTHESLHKSMVGLVPASPRRHTRSATGRASWPVAHGCSSLPIEGTSPVIELDLEGHADSAGRAAAERYALPPSP